MQAAYLPKAQPGTYIKSECVYKGNQNSSSPKLSRTIPWISEHTECPSTHNPQAVEVYKSYFQTEGGAQMSWISVLVFFFLQFKLHVKNNNKRNFSYSFLPTVCS